MMNIAAVLSAVCCLLSSSPAGAQDTLFWPQPPERPRIKHIQTISSAASFKEEHGVFSKLLRFVFGGDASKGWLVQPVGVGVSREGEIFVADPGAGGVHRINLKEREHKLYTDTKYGTFRSPVGVACGDDGRVYVSDADNGTVIITDHDLDAKSVIRDHLVRPTGLAIVRQKLYVADAKRHAVVVFDLDGNYLTEFGRQGTGDGEFNYPVQVAGRDSAVVVDALNYRLQIFTATDRFSSAFGKQGNALGRFASPKAAALDSDGDIYVSDALMDNVQIFNGRGQLLLSFGQHGAASGEFMMPSGIAIDRQDRVYIVDTMNRRVQIFQYMK
jgi:DNA-binding beta-propeller fold protein YncE